METGKLLGDKASAQHRPTRGNGMLEPLLAHLRARKANELIPEHLREGRVLDIGCGSYPYFLSHTSFREKFALDRFSPGGADSQHPFADIRWFSLDLNKKPILPFESGFFNIITLLAVAEHLNPASLVTLLQEAHRTLRPGGYLILTTPAAWTGRLLKILAAFKLVSKEEIEEHVYAYSLPLLGWYFGKAGFQMEKTSFGYFEITMNLWATAER